MLRYGNVEKTLSGAEKDASSNRMEILAMFETLSLLKEPCEVTIFTGNEYICDSIAKGWVYSWKSKNWKKNKKKPTAHADLWEKLLPLLGKHQITTCYSENSEELSQCRELAHEERDNFNQ